MNIAPTPNFALVPAYYEWHLIDTNKPQEVLFNIVDPLEDLYDYPDGTPSTYEEVVSWMESSIDLALQRAEDGEDWNGVIVNKNSLPDNAAEIMAAALYNYYIA